MEDFSTRKLVNQEARELVKPFIYDKVETVFKNAMKVLEKQYPQNILASQSREIKLIYKIRAGDGVAYRQLLEFLIICQSLDHFPSGRNTLDSPDAICMILAKVPVHFQNCWNKRVQIIG